MSYTILSVGGSIVIPKTGFDLPFLKKFRSLIIAEVRRGRRFILVIGGGGTSREYQSTLGNLVKTTPQLLDWMGIYATYLNAELVRLFFGDLAHTEVIKDPTKPFKTKKPIVVAAGWKPGWSTDNVAVLLAKQSGARELCNLSNIEYVYDSDPALNPDAKKLETVSWKEYKQIVGSKWTPGMSAPFDPVATKLAERLKLRVYFVKGTDLGEVQKLLRGKPYQGTVIG
jgi:uridylate kinase